MSDIALTRSAEALDGVIFDLDGTLTDTLPIAFAAFRAAVAQFTPRQFTDEDLVQFFGPTEEGILQRILPHDWQRCFEQYLDEYTSRHVSCSAPFPGMTDVLDFLKGRGIPLALVTGKTPRALAITLQHVDIARYFDMVEAGSPEGGVKPRALRKVIDKWRVDARSVAYVGDATSDMDAANEIGLIAVGAAWDATADASALKSAGANVVFTRIGDFFDWLRAWISERGHGGLAGGHARPRPRRTGGDEEPTADAQGLRSFPEADAPS
jgi:pyrophosphatase PpaX